MDRALLLQLGKAAYAIFASTRSAENLWGRPINDFDLERAVNGSVTRGTAEWGERIRMPFGRFSITVSSFVVNGLTKIFSNRDELVIKALSSLNNHKDAHGAYWSDYKPLTLFGGTRELDVSPRHTATALQIYHHSGDNPPDWNSSIKWLLDSQNDDGGWGKWPRSGPSDCVSTSSVINVIARWIKDNAHSSNISLCKRSVRDALTYLQNIYKFDPEHAERQCSSVIFQYHGHLHRFVDACHCIENVLAVLDADWLDNEHKSYIVLWLEELNRYWNEDGSLGNEEPATLANAVWGLFLLYRAQTVVPSLNIERQLTRASTYIENELSHRQGSSKMGLAEWGILSCIIGSVYNVRVSADFASDMRQSFVKYKYEDDPYFRVMAGIDRDVRRLVGPNIVFSLSEGRYRDTDAGWLMRAYRSLGRKVDKVPNWARWIISLSIAVCVIVLRAIGIL